MSVAVIIKQLDQLIQLHSSLSQLSAQKTEAIKTNTIDKLNTLLNSEQKYVKAIEQIENTRQQEVNKLLAGQASNHFQAVLEVATAPEKEQLISKREQLLHIVEELKNQNNLNRQLIFHSLQYINISLDMLRPQNQQANFNYEMPANAKQRPVNRTMFDSKA